MKAETKGNNIQTDTIATLLSAADAARMCRISRRTWFRLVSAGKTPASVRVGGSPRWRRGDLDDWIRMGCPKRREFEVRKGAEKC